MSFPTFKACEDLLLAHGVNVMNPHLSHVSLAGIASTSGPRRSPTTAVGSPGIGSTPTTWPAAAVLSQGSEINRVLLLQPTTTLWMHYEHPAFHPGQGPVCPKLKAIGEGHFDIFFALADRQVDFDLGDEAILAELGKASRGKLVVGQRAYDLVVVPNVMENWTESTLGLNGAVSSKGGRIVQLGAQCNPRGRPAQHGRLAELRKKYAGQWESAADAAELASRVAGLVPPRLTGATVRRCRRALPGGGPSAPTATPCGSSAIRGTAMTMDVRIPGRQLLNLDTGLCPVPPSADATAASS